jgi:adenylate cyclase
VRVVYGASRSPPPEADEYSTLERVHAPFDVRLACQWRPDTDIAVVPLFSAQSVAARRQEEAA